MPYTDPLTGNLHGVPLVSADRRARLIEAAQQYAYALNAINYQLTEMKRSTPWDFPSGDALAQKTKKLYTNELSIESMLVSLSDAMGRRKYPFKELEIFANYLGKDLPQRIALCNEALEMVSSAEPFSRDPVAGRQLATIRSGLETIAFRLDKVASLLPQRSRS